MSAPTYVLNDNWAHVITLFRNDERISHVFRDHYITFHDVEENGRGMIYYIVAHDYGTGEEKLVFLKDKDEFQALRKEMSRNADEAGSFKKKIQDYKRQIGKSFVKAVEAARCARFCDELLKEQEALAPKKPVAVHGSFGIEPRIGLEPRVSDEELKKLCMEPLKATTDPLKLKELEERFPGATMVLSTPTQQGVIKYVYEELYVDVSANHKISCDFAGPLPWPNFAMLGVVAGKRPQLMAEWRDMYIDLSHLF